ncbi:hypothetical protein MRB53_040678 [Persea americana]|nr:hypothetical protein MRB53_040678 [Persea americana]
MQALGKQIPPTIFETFPRTVTSATARATSTPQTSQRQFRSTAGMANTLSFEGYKIQTKTIPERSSRRSETVCTTVVRFASCVSNIERLGGQVTSSGNPIEMDLKTRYTVKGLGSQQTIDSKIKIWTEGEGDNMRISRVEDRWDDNLPDTTFKNAMRNLNSVVVPKLVSVPKSIEEEEKSS